MKKNDSLQKIAEYIKNNDNYLIIGHIDPDGDAIGSVMAYKFLLDNLNKNSLIIFHDDHKKAYKILFRYLKDDDYYVYDKSNLNSFSDYQTAIVLDSANQDRLGKFQNIVDNFFIINIDHHQDNSKFGDLNYVNSKQSAVGKIIYELSRLINIEITEPMGTAIALAVLADTGSLKYPNSDPDTFRLIARLKEKGIDIVKINRFLDSFPSLRYLKLLSKSLDNIKADKSGKIAWLTVSNGDIRESKVKLNEINNLVNYPRDIRGVEVGISFVEKSKGFIDISFRSLSYVDVSKIAHKFNGGGHPRASGAKIRGDLEEIIQKVVTEVKKYV